MDDAAGRTAASTGTADREALDALIFDWGEAYIIGRDDKGCWWAARRDCIGHLLTARDPVELRAGIRADYELKPVPRELAEAETGPAPADPAAGDAA